MSFWEKLKAELSKAVVGQERVLEGMAAALLGGGHALLVGVPGLAKTLMVKSLAKALGLKFSRIQFTPDLMPSDVTGTEVLRGGEFEFVPGPVFTNVLLADEINRTPPKTQAALLEAMQELAVTAGGKTYPLEPPFFVLATQNPIEQEGTYPLPEAQLDRFMFELRVDYPSFEEELKIAQLVSGEGLGEPEPVLSREEILEAQRRVRALPLPEHTLRFAVALARATRPQDPLSTQFIRKYVQWGAGPRASQFLLLGAKALAWMRGEPVPTSAHVREVAPWVLSHRVILNFHAEAEGIGVERVIEEAIGVAEGVMKAS